MIISLFSNELKISFFYFIVRIIILIIYLKIFYLNLIIFIFILIFIRGIFFGIIYLINFSINYKNIFNLYPLLLLVIFIDLKLENINFL